MQCWAHLCGVWLGALDLKSEMLKLSAGVYLLSFFLLIVSIPGEGMPKLGFIRQKFFSFIRLLHSRFNIWPNNWIAFSLVYQKLQLVFLVSNGIKIMSTFLPYETTNHWLPKSNELENSWICYAVAIKILNITICTYCYICG